MSLPLLSRIRQIARAGDTDRAWQMFETSGLSASDGPEALALKGRLLKDQAFRLEGKAWVDKAREAVQAYHQSAGGRAATYPLINAATIAYLCGDVAEAQNEARSILAMIERGDYEPETPYWLDATVAEAQLLLGDASACRRALARAMAAVPEAWEDQAATIRQLREILVASDGDLSILDPLRLPPSLHFNGVMGLGEEERDVRDDLEGIVDQVRPGAVFGALAAGTDILAAELALSAGAQLHVVLPANVEEFLEISVYPFGGTWGRRCKRLLDRADSVVEFAEHPGLTRDGIIQATKVAMGLSIRHARALATEAVAVHVGRLGEESPKLQGLWEGQGKTFHALLKDFPRNALPDRLSPAKVSVVLASSAPFPQLPGRPETCIETDNGHWLMTFDTIREAARYARDLLRENRDLCLGIDPCVVRPGAQAVHYGQRAVCLSRAGQGGDICGPWPHMAIMDLVEPALRFEASGELVTPFGDVPLARLGVKEFA